MSDRRDPRPTAKLARLAATLIELLPLQFNLLANLKKSYPLVIVGSIETGLPFVRMLALTHILSLTQIGFISVLTAFSIFLEVSTDIAIYRFVYSAPKDRYEEALASAHALALVRGVAISILAVCVAPLVASAVSLGDSWTSFALLGPPMLIRSFENLSPRIAERDFRYWPQVGTMGVTATVSIVVMIIVALITRNYYAMIASTYAQVVALVLASRIFADVPYRIDFRSPLFKTAFRFSYPLLFNGLGLSIAMQGDRFVVAAFFDLKTLAIYSVILLTATVPLTLLNRVLQTTILARFYHASSDPGRLNAEVKLAASVVAVLAALYGGGVVLLLSPVVTLVFGAKFHADPMAMGLLGAAAFTRLARTEPFTSVMLNASRTKRLAASNILTSSALAYMVGASFLDRSINGLLGARLAGELTSWVVTFFMARRAPEGGRFAFTLSTLVALLFFGLACLGSYALGSARDSLLPSLAATVVFVIAVLAWGVVDLRRRMSRLRAAIVQGQTAATDASAS
ncbi:O-antigen/teichoic acid export membrane protein [Roseiarcus fermentans]|uniref:O-antigen/teichoic acid export membrane protein n=1 Tax=Roseiarcus fermentans TaxID=1473586 RepID=A0A366FA22_9HYPH|nr:oligosaccharide flippase family protein [Roseiarcus fermentans]RBP10565.1 O-antigen/teichoic acid export membrane protein [Roseiarcus fermentans]